VQAAAQRVPPALQDSMQRLVRIVEDASSPGEEFAQRVIRCGVQRAVNQLARGEG
jgi:glutamate--cysteine ligase